MAKESIGVSASPSVLPVNNHEWVPLGWTCWISLQSKGLSRVFSNTTVQKNQFFVDQFCSHHFMAKRWGDSVNTDRLYFGGTVETLTDFIWGGSKITADSDSSHEIKSCLLHWRNVMTNLNSILKKQRHYFPSKGPSSQSYGFSSSHVWMWGLDYKESRVLKNWCFCNCGVGEDCWEYLELQGDPSSPS